VKDRIPKNETGPPRARLLSSHRHSLPGRSIPPIQAVGKAEKGGYVVRAAGEDGQAVHAKASKVFRKHFAGKEQRAATEAKLGEWRPPEAYVQAVAKVERRYSPHREAKRDPDKRQAQREERARERAALKGRFQTYKADFYAERAKARQADQARAKERFRELAAKARAEREKIHAADATPEIRRVLRSIAAFEAVQARERLRAELAAERRAKGQARPMDYRTWLVVQASQGDKAAESQLRSWAYQERRREAEKAKQRPGEVEAHADRDKPAEGRPQRPTASPAAVRDHLQQDRLAVALRTTWQADVRAGTVDYFVDGRKACTDRGARVTDIRASRHDEVEVALRLSVQKFGKAINVKGAADFKRMAVEVAVVRGIDVQFSDKTMQADYERLKAARAAALAEARQKGSAPVLPAKPGEAIAEAFRAVRDQGDDARAAVARNHPELAKALALDKAAHAAAEKLPPDARETFIRETRGNIERDLAAGKPLPDVREQSRDRTHDLNHDQDRDL